MSPSLLRSRCAHAFHTFRIPRQANVLPEERSRVAATPLASVSQRTTTNLNPSFTLNPERFSDVDQRTVDISHLNVRTLGKVLPMHGISFNSPQFRHGARGVFYYHKPTSLPPLAGGLRFRICRSPAQFAQGKDLEVEVGEPWSMPLVNLVKSGRHQKTIAHLVKEGLVDQELVADLETFPESKTNLMRSTALYDINQPFVVDLGASCLTLRFYTRTSRRTARLRPFMIFRARGPRFRPFSGRMKARFELHEEEKSPKLHLRFLEILTPITHNPPDGLSLGSEIIEPSPGNLLIRRKIPQDMKPWTHSLSLESGNGRVIREFLAERALEKEKYGI